MGFFYSQKKQELLNLQALVLNRQEKRLVLSEKQIYQAAKDITNNNIRIIKDCANILDDTVNPDTFFSRYNLMIENSSKLIRFEPYLIDDNNWTETHKNLVYKKQSYIYAFINRYLLSTINKVNGLKTEKAKLRNIQNFFQSLEEYKREMSEENIIFYTNRYNDLKSCFQ